jgi:hypothetical protein
MLVDIGDFLADRALVSCAIPGYVDVTIRKISDVTESADTGRRRFSNIFRLFLTLLLPDVNRWAISALVGICAYENDARTKRFNFPYYDALQPSRAVSNRPLLVLLVRHRRAVDGRCDPVLCRNAVA